MNSPLRLDELVEALRQLGGTAEVRQIKDRVTHNRGGVPQEFNNMRWRNEMQTMIENHCHGAYAEKYLEMPIVFKVDRYGAPDGDWQVVDDSAVISLSWESSQKT